MQVDEKAAREAAAIALAWQCDHAAMPQPHWPNSMSERTRNLWRARAETAITAYLSATGWNANMEAARADALEAAAQIADGLRNAANAADQIAIAIRALARVPAPAVSEEN